MKSPSSLLDLEAQLQAQLHRAVASRTDFGIACCEVGCLAPAAERRGAPGVIAVMRAIICAVRIGDGGVIEQVEELDPELGAVPFLEREGLEYREIPILEAVVAEDVPAHGAKGSRLGRNHDRVAVYVAATRSQRTRVGGDRRTLRTQY